MAESTFSLPATTDEPCHEANTPEARSAALPRVLLAFHSRDDNGAAMLRGIAQHVQEHAGWSVVIDDHARSAGALRWLLAQGWCGVISRGTTAALVEGCAEFGLPLVDLDDSPQYAGVSKIRPDNIAMGALGAECFLDRGFQHFGFVGCADHGWARERQSGFVEAVQLGGHEAATFDLDPTRETSMAAASFDGRALAAWLKRLPKPVGLMACDDRCAIQVLEAARAADIQVPEELAVLGADNDVVRCELAMPPLSSVARGAFQAGFCAAKHLAQRLGDPAAPTCDLRIEPAGIVTRRSTDVLAIANHAVAAAVRHIADHACDGLTVAEVLPHAGVSRAQLEKKFRQYLGRSPQAEIRRVQVARIRNLLANTNLPLKRIAELTGFDYMEYMCVVFRRLTGVTPGAFRRSRQPAGRPLAADEAAT